MVLQRIAFLPLVSAFHTPLFVNDIRIKCEECFATSNVSTRRTTHHHLSVSLSDDDEELSLPPNFDDDESEAEFIERELAHIEMLEEVLRDLESYEELPDGFDEQHGDASSAWNREEGLDALGRNDGIKGSSGSVLKSSAEGAETESYQEVAARGLENALLQGVVPVCAGVGSDGLPGDFGFDPLGLSERDLFFPVQKFLVSLLPASRWAEDASQETTEETERPKALILRDYREAEIRHGRLAMLAAIFWPLQEMLDQFVLSEDQFGPLLFGSVTLPFFPLLMTGIMLLMGYLDIYSQAIKDMEGIGEAFLPGDCFWDPLKILDGAPERTKRNMQERELFNGRAAMIAFAAYLVEELTTGQALIDLENNALLLRPLYQVPFVQQWLDGQFALHAHTDAPSALLGVLFLDPSSTLGSVL